MIVALLVIGYGSIGMRHKRVAEELGHSVRVVSRRAEPNTPTYPTVKSALQESPSDAVVVSRETSAHLETLKELAQETYQGIVLLEKPVSLTPLVNPLQNDQIFVGYNLRFHPLVQELAQQIHSERLLSLDLVCGSYLPEWRPGTDYTKTASAQASSGGGVLGDLSHELDLSYVLAGAWKSVSALGGRFGDLDIDVADTFHLLFATDRCPAVSIRLSYLERFPRREIVAVTAAKTYRLDFLAGTLSDGEILATHSPKKTLEQTYVAQMKEWLGNRAYPLATFREGQLAASLIQAANLAAKEQRWVSAHEEF